MGIKIFVTGFSNSGTSLTRRLIEAHPNVRIMLHEKYMLNKISTGDVLKFDIHSCNWGEKIPFMHKGIKRFANRSIISYMKIWRDFFEPDCKFVWVIRHPVDIILGNLKHRKAKFIKNADFKLQRMTNKYKSVFPLMLNDACRYDFEIKFVKFENLLLRSIGTLRDLFAYLTLRNDIVTLYNVMHYRWTRKRDTAINPLRAYAYSSNTIPKDIYSFWPEIGEHIDLLNFLDSSGVVYYK